MYKPPVRCGPLIDLCRGPHVRHTGKIKAMKIYKVSGKISSLGPKKIYIFQVISLQLQISLNVFWMPPLQNSSTYWEGRCDMETLQRIYGISFPDSKMLKEWERFQEEAKNRDHRKIGKVSHGRRSWPVATKMAEA